MKLNHNKISCIKLVHLLYLRRIQIGFCCFPTTFSHVPRTTPETSCRGTGFLLMEVNVLCYHQLSYHNWRHIEVIFKFVSPVFISAEETDYTRSAKSSPDTAVYVGSAVVQLCIMQTYFMTGPGARTKVTFPVFRFISAMRKVLQIKVSCRNEIRHVATHLLCVQIH